MDILGHDTTASSIGFTLWWLGQYPEYQDLVHKELDGVFGNDTRLPTNEDIKQLVYLEKCIKVEYFILKTDSNAKRQHETSSIRNKFRSRFDYSHLYHL